MVSRRFLVELFEQEAKPKGWCMDEEDFPPDIAEEVFPHPHNIFKALALISPRDVNFVILGQDPYFTSTDGVPDATGVAFAISSARAKKPQSLIRILKKVYHGNIGNPELTDWITERGVLLLNAALTVPAGNSRKFAGAHLKDGRWNKFVGSIISQVRRANPDAVLIAWGNKTRAVLKNVLGNEDDFLWAHHPVASTAGIGSFEHFWEREEVKQLPMPQ